MNLKIKCDTPREQVLVLRKFKKLVPECGWNNSGIELLNNIPFVDSKMDQCNFCLHNDNTVTYGPLLEPNWFNLPEFTASDFLRDDWKLEEKSELHVPLVKSEILKKLVAIQSQVSELEKLIKKESL